MIVFVVISIVVFALYIGAVVLMNGVPNSVSESYYVLGERSGLLASLFTWFCWLTALPLLIYWFSIGGGVLAFFSCGGLMFVGAAPMFKEEFERRVHMVSAGVCFAGAYAWLMLFGNKLIFWTSVLILFNILVFAKRNRMFWLEFTAFLTFYITVFYRFFEY